MVLKGRELISGSEKESKEKNASALGFTGTGQKEESREGEGG